MLLNLFTGTISTAISEFFLFMIYSMNAFLMIHYLWANFRVHFYNVNEVLDGSIKYFV